MGSVVKKVIFSRKALSLTAIFLVYFIAGFSFVYFGLTPASSAKDTYAKEARHAVTSLEIPKIDLNIPVEDVNVKDNNLEVPEQIVGRYSAHDNKTLLIGHSTTAFSDLDKLEMGDFIKYEGAYYRISKIEQLEKSDISMKEILKAEEEYTIVLMTCAGEQINATDFSERLIITASDPVYAYPATI